MFYSPACVADQIQHSARRASDVRALSLQDRSGWRAPILWRPILESLFCDGGPGWEKHQQSALRGLVAGTYWTQSRLREQDAAVDSLCLVCGEARGTLHHRCYQCPAHAAWRRDNVSVELAKAAECVSRAPAVWGERFARGIFPDPGLCASRPEF